MKALVQEGFGSADVLHLREIAPPAISDDRVLVKRAVATSLSPLRATYHEAGGPRPSSMSRNSVLLGLYNEFKNAIRAIFSSSERLILKRRL
jgi:hypothetical protein